MNLEDIEKLKVPELKKELKNRGLLITGNKAELVSRLHEAENTTGETVEKMGTDDDTKEVAVQEELSTSQEEPVIEGSDATAQAGVEATPEKAAVENKTDEVKAAEESLANKLDAALEAVQQNGTPLKEGTGEEKAEEAAAETTEAKTEPENSAETVTETSPEKVAEETTAETAEEKLEESFTVEDEIADEANESKEAKVEDNATTESAEKKEESAAAPASTTGQKSKDGNKKNQDEKSKNLPKFQFSEETFNHVVQPAKDCPKIVSGEGVEFFWNPITEENHRDRSTIVIRPVNVADLCNPYLYECMQKARLVDFRFKSGEDRPVPNIMAKGQLTLTFAYDNQAFAAARGGLSLYRPTHSGKVVRIYIPQTPSNLKAEKSLKLKINAQRPVPGVQSRQLLVRGVANDISEEEIRRCVELSNLIEGFQMVVDKQRRPCLLLTFLNCKAAILTQLLQDKLELGPMVKRGKFRRPCWVLHMKEVMTPSYMLRSELKSEATGKNRLKRGNQDTAGTPAKADTPAGGTGKVEDASTKPAGAEGSTPVTKRPRVESAAAVEPLSTPVIKPSQDEGSDPSKIAKKDAGKKDDKPVAKKESPKDKKPAPVGKKIPTRGSFPTKRGNVTKRGGMGYLTKKLAASVPGRTPAVRGADRFRNQRGGNRFGPPAPMRGRGGPSPRAAVPPMAGGGQVWNSPPAPQPFQQQRGPELRSGFRQSFSPQQQQQPPQQMQSFQGGRPGPAAGNAPVTDNTLTGIILQQQKELKELQHMITQREMMGRGGAAASGNTGQVYQQQAQPTQSAYPLRSGGIQEPRFNDAPMSQAPQQSYGGFNGQSPQMNQGGARGYGSPSFNNQPPVQNQQRSQFGSGGYWRR